MTTEAFLNPRAREGCFFYDTRSYLPNFPGTLPDKNELPDTSGTEQTGAGPVTHSQEHTRVNNEVIAIATKVGTDGSGNTSSLDHLVKGALNPGHTHNGSSLSGVITNPMTGVGDVIVGGTSGTPTRLAGAGQSGLALMSNASGTEPSWQVPPGGGGGGFANPMTTQGDLITGGASGTPQRLAAGTSGLVLTSNGSGQIPSWQTGGGGGGGFTNPMTTAGDIIIGGSSGTPLRLGNGNSTDLLQSGGGGTLTWTPANFPNVLNVQSSQFGAFGNGTHDDTANINNALATCPPGGCVYMPFGTYKISTPLVVPPYVTLMGDRDAFTSFDDNNFGTVIMPTSTFSSSRPVKAAIVLLDQQSGGGWNSWVGGAMTYAGSRISNLIIEGSNGAVSMDGIAAYGGVCGVGIEKVAILNVSGNFLAAYNNGSSIDRPFPDGWRVQNMLLDFTQGGGGDGFHDVPGDTTVFNVHSQNCGGYGFTTAHGGNIRFVACRADLCGQSGWQIAHQGGTAFQDATILSACSTERNNHHGVKITIDAGNNPTGTGYQSPVIIQGCNLGEDGRGASPGFTGGNFAGIFAEGFQNVYISDTCVFTGNVDCAASCPKYGLMTGTAGSGNGSPNIIQMTGGHLNFSGSGGQNGAPINDAGAVAQWLLISAQTTASFGNAQVNNSNYYARRGTTTLSGGNATVTTPWATTHSFILATHLTAGGTMGNLAVARSDGSFTINSSNSADTSLVLWEMVSG